VRHIWWGEAPARLDRCREESSDPRSVPIVRPLSAPSRWSIVGHGSALLWALPVHLSALGQFTFGQPCSYSGASPHQSS